MTDGVSISSSSSSSSTGVVSALRGTPVLTGENGGKVHMDMEAIRRESQLIADWENRDKLSDIEPDIQNTLGAYPFNKPFRFQNGVMMEVFDKLNESKVHIYHPAGTFLEIVRDGSVHIHSAKDLPLFIKGKATIYSKGDALVHSEANTTVYSGANTTINSKGPATINSDDDITITSGGITHINP
jgi:hypothetical protein